MALDLAKQFGLDLGPLKVADARQARRLRLELPNYVVGDLGDLLFISVENGLRLVEAAFGGRCRLVRQKPEFCRKLRL